MDGLPQVAMHIDGSCMGNPGRGGYGVVLVAGERRRELTGGRQCTTNNRMELLAAIEGLKALRTRCAVTIFSDSRYLVDGMQRGWAKRWGLTLNADLWEQCLDLCERHAVTFHWVRGHSGVADNETCHQLARSAAQENDLPADEGYEERGTLSAAHQSRPGFLFERDERYP